MSEDKITGIILAGGKSSRMGEEKGLVQFKGKPMIEYSIELFQKLGYEIMIIANNSSFGHYGFPVYSDIISDKGPMAGIYTALHHSSSNWNAVITCDVPLVDPTVFHKLEESKKGFDAVMPNFKNRLQPLTAMYKTNCEDVFYKSIQKNQLRVRMLKNEFPTNIVKFDKSYSQSFMNINTKEDIEKCK